MSVLLFYLWSFSSPSRGIVSKGPAPRSERDTRIPPAPFSPSDTEGAVVHPRRGEGGAHGPEAGEHPHEPPLRGGRPRGPASWPVGRGVRRPNGGMGVGIPVASKPFIQVRCRRCMGAPPRGRKRTNAPNDRKPSMHTHSRTHSPTQPPIHRFLRSPHRRGRHSHLQGGGRGRWFWPVPRPRRPSPSISSSWRRRLGRGAAGDSEGMGVRPGGDGGLAGIVNRKPLHSALGFPTLSVVSTLLGPRGPGMHGGGPLMHVDPFLT